MKLRLINYAFNGKEKVKERVAELEKIMRVPNDIEITE